MAFQGSRRLRAPLLVLLTATSVLSAACGDGDGGDGAEATRATPTSGATGATGVPEGDVRAAVLFPGLIDDGAFNQLGFRGVQQAKAEGVDVAFQEGVTQDQQEEAFRNFAQQDYTTIVGYGGQFMDAALRVAEEFPETEFVVINGDRSAANVTSIGVNYYSLGYLAGVLSASMTQTKQVGLVVALEIPAEQETAQGFADGVASVDSSIEVKTIVTGDFDDIEKAREATLALIDQGVDVLWPFLNAGVLGFYSAISDSADKGVMAVGSLLDESSLAPQAVVGSILGDLGHIVFQVMSEPDLLDHQASYWGVAQGIVSVTFAFSVPEEVRQTVHDAEEFLAGQSN
jgi:basic membrane protein A